MGKFFGFAEELLKKGCATIADPYANAELYDFLVQGDHDAQFYVNLAQKQGGRLLDLACGSGRLIPYLLDGGLDVVGLDLSIEMLKQAKKKLGKRARDVEFVEGDMRNFSFEQKFNTIIIPYCSLMYMHNDGDRLAVFQRCYEHLNPGGYFAFDFLAGEMVLGDGIPTLAMQGIHPFTEEILMSVVQLRGLTSDLRLLNQINYAVAADTGLAKITVHSSKEAIVTPERICTLLQRVGFALEGVYNNYTHQPYDGGEECLIVAQRK